jgi:dihydrofolate synthase/folylpolyglutamate synthase
VEVAKQQRASLGGLPSLPSDESEPDQTYRAALDWIWSFSARPRSQREMANQRAVKLERMQALLSALGHPELSFPSVLVSGTKGKGSTVAMLAGCLRSAGYLTGRYTSPHLLNWRERITIDGEPIPTAAVLRLTEPIRRAVAELPSALGPLTTFEVGTAFAFVNFAQQNVEVAVVEVGTGGRFDATNLVEPSVAVVTPVSYDHTQTLGSTLTSIAWHKAGIMRPRRPAVSAPQSPEAQVILESEARLLDVKLEEVGREWRWSASDGGMVVDSTHVGFESLHLEPNLIGNHQRDNATTVVAALHALNGQFPVRRSDIQMALRQVEWPGRLQVLTRSPWLVLDGAHNAASAEVLRQALDSSFEFERLLLVVGLSEGKDALGVLSALTPRAASVYLTRSSHERSAKPSDLEPLVRASTRARVGIFADAADAFEQALAAAGPRDLVLVTGSLFLVGEALDWWRRSSR